jgi:peptidylprolyl isomerase
MPRDTLLSVARARRRALARMKHLAVLTLLACGLSACGDASKDAVHESEPAAEQAKSEAAPATPSPLAEPITIDKGDGCTVVIHEQGRGPAARIGDALTIDYVGRVRDSEAPFATTSGWNERCRIELGTASTPRVVAGLARGLEGLKAGSKATITVPPALGYGKSGLPDAGIPADATLVFEVEVAGVGR